jgi:hypothetical protein
VTTIIDSLIVSLGLDASGFDKGQKNAVNALNALEGKSGKSNKQIQSDADKSTKAFARFRNEILGVATAFMSIGAMKTFSEKITNDDASLGRLAKNLDTSVETLSSWGMAANKAGGSADEMYSSIQKITSGIQQFSQTGEGGANFRYFMSGPGGLINLVDKATGKMRPFSDIMSESADKLKSIADTKGMAAAQEWGKGMGFDVGTVNNLVLGSKEWAKIVATQKELGIVTAKDVAEAQARQIEWNKFADTIQNLGRDILLHLSPAIISLTKEGEKFIKSFDLDTVNKGVDSFADMLKHLSWQDAKNGANEFLSVIERLLAAIEAIAAPFKAINQLGKDIGGGIFDVTHSSIVADTLKQQGADLANSAIGALISRGEGDYNSVHANGKGETRDLNKMTVDEVLASQKAGNFHAAGRYQMIKGTLQEGKKSIGLSGKELFDKGTQDRLFNEYLLKNKRKALENYFSRGTDEHAAQVAMAKEFASVAHPDTGKSYYPGQKATISSKEIQQAMRQSRSQMGSTSTSTSDVKIGTINVVTQATDAKGIAKDMTGALKSHTLINQANAGM